MSHRLPFVAILAVVSALGCGPATSARQPGEYRPPEGDWRDDEAEGADIDPERAGPMSLARMLAFADAHAPALELADRRAEVAEAEVEGAETLVPYNPELSVSAGGRSSDRTRFTFGASLEQRLEIAGQRGTRVEAAERARDAVHADRDVIRGELRARIREGYYLTLARRDSVASARDIVAFAESVEALLARRVAAQEDSPLTATVARADTAEARQALIVAESAVRAGEIQLAELIGWPPEVSLQIAGKLAPPRRAPNVRALAARALRKHPSRRWLELQVLAADARIEREDRAAWPDPSLAISYSYEPDAGVVTHVWLGTLRVPLPIWERNQAGRARARADAGLVRAEQAAFAARLRARIATAAVQVDAAAARAELFGSDILPAFNDNLAKLRRAFEAGEIDLLQLSQVRGRLLTAEANARAALADYYAAVAELEALAGASLPQR